MTPCDKHWLEKARDSNKNEVRLSLVIPCDSQGIVFVIRGLPVQFRQAAPLSGVFRVLKARETPNRFLAVHPTLILP